MCPPWALVRLLRALCRTRHTTTARKWGLGGNTTQPVQQCGAGGSHNGDWFWRGGGGGGASETSGANMFFAEDEKNDINMSG